MAEHTPTPWFYRSGPHDDWGWIRGTSSNGEIAPLVACARSGEWESAQMMDDHRTAKTDPYAANAEFIVKAVNSHADAISLLEAASASLWRRSENSLAREIDRFLDRVSPSSGEKVNALLTGDDVSTVQVTERNDG